MSNSPAAEPAVNCRIYRCRRKSEMYLYLRSDMEDTELPEALLELTGTLDFSFDLQLTAERSLARENTATVLANLREKGFHLQMPPADSLVLQVQQDERLPSSLDVG